MAVKDAARVDRTKRLDAEPHLFRASLNHETAPIDPIDVGAWTARRIDDLPTRIAAHPCFAEFLERAIALLQPILKRCDGLIAVAIELLVCRRIELASS